MTLSEARRKEKVKIILMNGKEIIGKICEYFYAEDEETDSEYDSFVFREAPLPSRDGARIIQGTRGKSSD